MNFIRSASRMLLAIFASALIPACLIAQSDLSSINGSVHDPSGAAIPNAKVTVKNENNGAQREGKTGGGGSFSFPSLPSGYYTITVENEGFKKYERKGQKLDAAIPIGVDVALEVGNISESVEVSAAAQMLQTENATVGKIVEQQQIKSLGLNGRNPLFLAQLKPGVQRSGSLAGLGYSLDNGGFAVNGARSEDSQIFFDGAVGTRTRSAGTSIGVANVDVTAEVQILTSNYSAEYGRSGGGQTRIVTKSGGHDFHGDVWEFLRNPYFNANEWNRNNSTSSALNSRPAAFRYNQFGYDLTGPVFIPKLFNTDRTKLFFTASTEWNVVRNEGTLTARVPSLAMRQGNFSELLGPNFFYNTPRVIRDPQTNQPFAGNIIPTSRLSANGQRLLGVYPNPTPGYQVGTNNYISSGPNPIDQRKDTFGLDVVPGQNHNIKLRAQNFTYTSADTFNGTWPIAPTLFNRPNQSGSANWTWTINPTTVNEMQASYSSDHVEIGIVGDAYRRSIYGVNYPYLYPAGTKDLPDKLPTVNIQNFSEYSGSPYPARSAGPIFTISNNTTKILNNHTLKFGVYFENSGQNDRDQVNVNGIPGGVNNQAGRFEFTDGRASGSGLSISDTALGLFNNYGEIGPRSYTPYRGNMIEYFVQDSWKVTPKLKVELGFRHSFVQPYYYSQWGNISVFDARFYNPAQAAVQNPANGFILGAADGGDVRNALYNGIVIPGDGFPDSARGRVAAADDPYFNNLFRGFPKTYASTRYNNVVPRIGIAYQADSRTVIRAGFGGFKNRPSVSDAIFLGGNAPFQGFQVVSTGSVENPGGGSTANRPSFVQTLDPVFKIPTSYQWNFTVERDLGGVIFTGAYVGHLGLQLERIRNLNQLPVGTAPAPYSGPNVDTLRPYKGFSQIQLAENAARSIYNGLQLELSKRFSKGFSFGAAYTLSKSYDNASNRRDILWNSYDARNFWGPSAFDTRQILVVNAVYDLPIFKEGNSLKHKLLGGWQLSAISQFQTGQPFSVTATNDFAGIGTPSPQPLEVNGDTHTANGAFSQGVGRDNNFWFATTNPNGTPIFTNPTPGTFSSTQTRNQFYHPGFQNHNVSVLKNFSFTERTFIQLRADAFNFVNHPNFSNVDNNPNNATFGRVVGKNGNFGSTARQMQLGLKLTF